MIQEERFEYINEFKGSKHCTEVDNTISHDFATLESYHGSSDHKVNTKIVLFTL